MHDRARSFTIRFDVPTSSVIAEIDGALAARLETIENAPHAIVLFHPRIEAGVDLLSAARAVVDGGLRRAADLGVARVKLLLDDRFPHADAFVVAAPAWGFELDVTKALVRAPVDDVLAVELPPLPAEAEFSPVAGPEDPALSTAFGEVLASAVTASDRASDPREVLASEATHCARVGGSSPTEDWTLLAVGGRAAGLVLPGFADASRAPCTNLYIGVLPWARGRGFAAPLVRRGVETMARRGATRYIGSCDVANAPMLRTFERLACKRISTQTVFAVRAAR